MLRSPRLTQGCSAERKEEGRISGNRVMKIKQWMEKLKGREKWRLIVEEAKTHPGL